MKPFKRLLLLIAILIPITATVTTVSALDSNTQSFVEAPKNILSSNEISTLNEKLQKYSESTINGEKVNTQFAVKIIDSLNNQSIESYGKNLFNKLGIGDSEHNLGILLIVSLQDHQFRVQLGNGWNNTDLNESQIQSHVFTNNVKDLLRSEDYNSAINEMVTSTMQLAGTTVTIPTELNIDSSDSPTEVGSYEFMKNFKNDMMSVIIDFLLVGILIFAPLFGVSLVSNFKKNKKIKRTKALLSKDIFSLANPSEDERNLLNNPIFLKSMNTLKDQDLDELAEEFVNDKYSTPQSLLKFVKSKAQPLEEQLKREKDLELINKLLKKDSKWALSAGAFGNEFLKTNLEITLENMKMFSENLKNNKKLLKKQKDVNTYNVNKQALTLTTQNPTIRFEDDLLVNLMTYQILSDSFRTSTWQDQHQTSYSNNSSYDDDDDDDDYNSYYSGSSFSDFGGGGFSDGGGASGGW